MIASVSSAAEWAYLGTVVAWAAFVAACIAHAVYHFRAAGEIRRRQQAEYTGPMPSRPPARRSSGPPGPPPGPGPWSLR